MNDLIISLAFDGREKYTEIQNGLTASLQDRWDGDIWINPDVPYTPHSEVPYKFKYDLIEAALQKGYRRIWWLDSTIRLKQNPSPLFFQTHSGIVAFNNEGHPLWKYISDQAMLNLTLKEAWIKNI